MTEETANLSVLVKRADSKLLKAEKELKEAKNTVFLLKEAFSEILKAEKISKKSDFLKDEFNSLVKEVELLKTLKKSSLAVNNLKKGLVEIEVLHNNAVMFLEQFRDYRKYVFHGSNELKDFVEAVLKKLNIERIVFKPDVGGIVDIDNVLKKFGQKANAQRFELSTDKVRELMNELSFLSIFSGYILICDLVKIRFTGKNSLEVKASPENIKEFDSLCLKHGCTFSSD